MAILDLDLVLGVGSGCDGSARLNHSAGLHLSDLDIHVHR
jgi:hypothetical protein